MLSYIITGDSLFFKAYSPGHNHLLEDKLLILKILRA